MIDISSCFFTSKNNDFRYEQLHFRHINKQATTKQPESSHPFAGLFPVLYNSNGIKLCESYLYEYSWEKEVWKRGFWCLKIFNVKHLLWSKVDTRQQRSIKPLRMHCYEIPLSLYCQTRAIKGIMSYRSTCFWGVWHSNSITQWR